MKPTPSFRRWFALVAAVLVLTLAACGSTSMDSSPASGGYAGAPEAPAADMAESDVMAEVDPELLREQGDAEPSGDGTMLIVNKTIRIEVPGADGAVEEIRRLAAAREGSITDMEVASDDGYVYPDDGYSAVRGWVVVRVPAAGYDAFVEDVSALGEVLAQSEASSDVTQQHVDLSARLANLRSQEERLRDFFDAAENVEEMLLVEKELGRVRGDIESLDAQVKHLERKAAMVTVNIHLSEPGALVDTVGNSWGFGEAVTSGLRGAVSILNGAVAFVIATSPVWIIGLVAFFPVRAWLRRRRAPKPSDAA